jgi:hypothetical protein
VTKVTTWTRVAKHVATGNDGMVTVESISTLDTAVPAAASQPSMGTEQCVRRCLVLRNELPVRTHTSNDTARAPAHEPDRTACRPRDA